MKRNLLSIVAILAGVVLEVIPAAAEIRSYDGTGNNLLNPSWGAAGTKLNRISPASYGDGFSTPAGGSRPSPRLISNTLVAQSGSIVNTHGMSNWVFQWGQFIDHDLDLTVLASPSEPFNISIPAGDPIFDPMNTGAQMMSFQRSHFDTSTGTGMGNPRQQINEITSFLDASMVYGSDATRANSLRAGSGGRLLTSVGNLLPLNTLGLPNGTGGPFDPAEFYVAGDVRANEQVGLTAVHTLFLREHNRLADEIALANPGWTDEQIYQRARKLVGGQIQSITFNEFLPAMLGPTAPSIVNFYDANQDPSVLTEFSTALFRVGHTMLPSHLPRIQNDGSMAPGGPLPLRDAFFVPQNLAGPDELQYMLKGLASTSHQQIDVHIVADVRDFLFGEPMAGGFDLASLNIQRGRDHGLADYNTLRTWLGLEPVEHFSDITSDPTIQAGLLAMYGDVNNIDPWVGALAEDHLLGAQVGPLIAAGLVEQFIRVRDGDRLWFLIDDELSTADKNWLTNRSLCDVILDNTAITNLQPFVFFIPEPSALALFCGAVAAVGGIRSRR